MIDRVAFTCNGSDVEVETAPGESLLSVLRERLAIVSAKDGCAPQGQCGCCTVLVDGAPRVSCVTPAQRIAGRSVTTVEGLDPVLRDQLAGAFVATGGSQCGFCTPGIVMRVAAPVHNLDRALAAHLCRCTGWRTIYDAVAGNAVAGATRDLAAAARRAELEGGVPQAVDRAVALGGAPFADDTAPRDALVAVPGPGGGPDDWIVATSLHEARRLAGKVQGRRTTVDHRPPLPLPDLPPGGVRLATSWVEPAYLEPDASWCEPGGEPASTLANGGAFGGKVHSDAPAVARRLADERGRTVRVVYSREDVVRCGPKRPPIAASAVLRDGVVEIEGVVARGGVPRAWPTPEGVTVRASWTEIDLPGPPVSSQIRAAGLAEQAVLVAGALGYEPVVVTESGARADATVTLDDATGALRSVAVRLAAGDPLDETVLRSYAIGAAHMALGWVLTEGLAVDPATGEIHDLTIRSFGIIRAKDMPPVDVTILPDAAPPRARSTDAVFAAVAAAAWNALTRAEGTRPDSFPARETRTARLLRR